MKLAELYAFEKENPSAEDLSIAVRYYDRAKKVFEQYFDANPNRNREYGANQLSEFEKNVLSEQ